METLPTFFQNLETFQLTIIENKDKYFSTIYNDEFVFMAKV